MQTYDYNIEAASPLMPWIVKRAAWVHKRYVLRTDGSTSYDRGWGNNYTKPVCEFGEAVRFQYALRP